MKIINYSREIISDTDESSVAEVDESANTNQDEISKKDPNTSATDESFVAEVDKSANTNQDEISKKDPNTSATSNNHFSAFCARCKKSIYERYDDVTLSPMRTNFIRGKNSYKKGVHLWSFRRPRCHRKTNAAIGVAAENAPTRKVGFRKPMMGYDEYSWMWDLDRNKLYHNNRSSYAFRFPERNEMTYRVGTEVWMILDMDRGTLSFGDKNGYLGVAFHDLNNRGNLYPVLTRISGTCHMRMNYIGTLSNGALFLYLISSAVRDNNLALSNGTNDHPKTFLSWILWKYHNHFLIARVISACNAFVNKCRNYFLAPAN